MSKTPNFDSIKRFDENGFEYWSARDLYLLLGYTKWERFDIAIQKAIAACSSLTPPIPVDEHFPTSWKAITGGHGAKQQVKDYQLSRLACYLIAQNGDTRKPEIAAAQFYFAVQTRRQELGVVLQQLFANPGLAQANTIGNHHSIITSQDLTSLLDYILLKIECMALVPN